MKTNAMLVRVPKKTPNVEAYVKEERNLSTNNNNDQTSQQPLNSNTLPKMSKPKQDRPRHSLQPQPISQPILGPLRHTKSQNYDKKNSVGGGAKKKGPMSTIPTIHEVDGESISGDVEIVNEKKKEKKRESVSSSGSKRRSYGYDNAAFEGSAGNLVGARPPQFQRSSTQHSLMSTTSSMRDVSVRSMPVIREQYCCCSRWSSCEKILITVVAILAAVIICLVIAVSYLVTDRGGISEAFQWSF